MERDKKDIRWRKNDQKRKRALEKAEA